MNLISKMIGSGFFTGYIPFASGTFGSLVALLIYLIPGFQRLEIIVPMIIIFSAWGIHLGNIFEKEYGKDPAQCTVDEVVGMWISLILVPKTFTALLIAFLVWRFFDIVKPPPARQLEKLKGGLGIMIDDIVAAFYALAVIHPILLLIRLF
ncbi:MAG TPA: phosphatidylglycerophosphatase A [Ignavibacteriaceae bacterium]|nr:phosphatidylglycerophosphatase A [Ignavibacteriaceae bacterium]